MFHPVRAPSAEQLHALLNQIIKRLRNLLTRKGYLVAEQGMTYLAETDTHSALAPLQSAAYTYRIARFHGVLAPHAKLPPQIISGRPVSVSIDLGGALTAS